MRGAEPLVRVEGAALRVGRRRFPLDQVRDASAEEEAPSLRVAALGLLASLICIPVLHALPLSDRAAMASFAGVGLVTFTLVSRLVFGGESYAVVLSMVEGARRVALRSGDHQRVVSVVAQIREVLRRTL